MSGRGGAVTETVIEPGGRRGLHVLTDAFGRRRLFALLAMREVKVRYAESNLGVAWAVLQPVALTAVFAFFARFVVRVDTGEVPYVVFAFAGLVPWTLFSTGLTTSSTSLLSNVALVSKVYFPRIILPVASVVAAIVDAAIGTVVVVALAALMGVGIGAQVLLAPAFLLLVAVAAAALGVALAGLVVRFRDVRHVVPLLVQLLLFLSPVIYPIGLVPERWHLLYHLNPLVGPVTGFRWAVTSGASPAPDLAGFLVSITVLAVLAVGSVVVFAATERSFADLV